MAKARPTRGQFPRGMKGDVMFRNALKKYKESMGPKDPSPKVQPQSKPSTNIKAGKGGSGKIDYSKYDVDRSAPKGPVTIKASSSKGSSGGGSGGGGGGGKPKPDKNAAYKAARDKIAKAQGKDAKAKATRNAEIVGLNAFIKAHEKKKGMAKAVAAAKKKLAEKQGGSKPEAPASKKGSSSPASSVKFTEEEKKKAQPFLSKSERTKQAQGK